MTRKSTYRKGLVIYSLLIILPLVYLVLLSLSTDWRYPDLWPHYIGLRNWQAVLHGASGLLESLGLSLGISILIATASTGAGFWISRTISRLRHRERWTSITYLPYIISPVVFGACLSYYFLRLGLYGTVGGVMLAHFLITLPYAVIFCSPFWNEKVEDYEQLAATLGADNKGIILKVLLPLSRNLLTICFFQTFLISWFEYGMSALIGVGKVQTLTVKVFLYIKEANFYYGAMSCCLLVIPPLVLVYLNRRYIFNKLL